ncbi:hypothetical protein [Candidatus Halobonum tyrrellensis]|uniref:Zinc/iron permease n=1 Tax=Candidatus Halobonum tyrrellensis G22 TaxID=1324957 RepID=V4J2A3_9EURY|nr:hypothetical protein [Candidatus Halobonum tyrrellensis]ESP89542.1 hypothetical protein K933_03260 [Candidatus Halobonum tyrrellensis G22]
MVGSLAFGALVGAFLDPSQKVTAAFLSFACGALVTVLSFELFERAVARGAVVASVATEAMPEAFGEGGDYVGFTTALGFLLTFLLK